MKGAAIQHMPRYCKFRGNVTAQLENPEFEDWQGSFTFTCQRCCDTRRKKDKKKRKQKDASDMLRNGLLLTFRVTVIVGKSVFVVIIEQINRLNLYTMAVQLHFL